MLLLQVAVDRASETRIRDPVRRPGLRRLKTPRHFVLALRAGLEALQTLLDTVLDSLVIARLEMQAMKLRRGAPVAAIERVAAAKEDRSRNRRAFQLGKLHYDGARQLRRDGAKEFSIEIVLVAAYGKRAGREPEHDVPEPRIHFLAGKRAEADAVLLHAPAFAQRFLALLGTERRKEGVEAGVVVVVPMELAVLAPEIVARTQRCSICVSNEQKVSRRDAFAARMLEQRRRHPFTRCLRFCQEAWAGGRREGRHAHELRVVAQASLLIRARPTPIEHELAPRIALAVQRQSRFDFAGGGLQQQMPRTPAGARADTTCALEREQELVTHERIAARLQRIPLLRGNAADRIDDAQRHFSACSRRRAGPDTCPHRALPCSRCRRR